VPGLKPNAWIPTVEASHFDVGTAYVAADHHQDDDYTPYAYVTTDFGKTWTRITGDLPAKATWVHVVREDPKNKNLLYLGAEMGAWASWDRGAHWSSLRGDLPVVQVRDIQVHPRDNDLLLATHGRGLYILDDITALQQLESVKSSEAVVFDMRPAVRWSMWSRDGNLGQKSWRGENPLPGALITYYLKDQPPGEVNVTISDKDGKVVRRIRRVNDEAGVNRVSWDLRYDAPPGGPAGGAARAAAAGAAPGTPADTSLEALRARRRAATEGATEASNDDNPFAGPQAPSVLPGAYTVALTVGGREYKKTVQVEMDPRSDMTPAQVIAQHDAAIQLRDLTLRVNQVIAGTDDMVRQLTGLQDQLRRSPRDGAASPDSAQRRVLADVDSAVKELRQFRDSVLARPLAGLGYRQYPRLREEVQTVSGMVWRPLMPPTAGEMLRLGELKTEADGAQARLDAIIASRVAKINQALAGTPHVITPTKPRFTP